MQPKSDSNKIFGTLFGHGYTSGLQDAQSRLSIQLTIFKVQERQCRTSIEGVRFPKKIFLFF